MENEKPENKYQYSILNLPVFQPVALGSAIWRRLHGDLSQVTRWNDADCKVIWRKLQGYLHGISSRFEFYVIMN